MRKLAKPLDVDFINKTFFPCDSDVSKINEGRCFLWAYTAFRLFKGLELWSNGSHAFVKSKVTGKFYDSETPHGAYDWTMLPATYDGEGCGCLICQKGARRARTIKQFQYTWRGLQKRYNVDYLKVDEKVKSVIHGLQNHER